MAENKFQSLKKPVGWNSFSQSAAVMDLKRLAFYAITSVTPSGFSILHGACVEGETTIVRDILCQFSPSRLDTAIALTIRVENNASLFSGFTPREIAADSDKDTCKELLLLIDEAQKEFQSQSLLHVASKRGYVEHIRRLVSLGAEVNKVLTSSNETPLMVAAMFNTTDVVRCLLDMGADALARGPKGFTAAHVAASKGRTDTLGILLEKCPQLKDIYCVGLTPLHLAAQNGHVTAIERLLNLKAEVDVKIRFTHDDKNLSESAQKGEDNGATPLMLASRAAHIIAARLLVSNGACVNARDHRGSTALSYAVREGHQEMFDFLAFKGADLTVCDVRGQTLLHVVRKSFMADQLISSGLGVHVKNKDGRTPLHCAVARGDQKVADLLIQHSSDINVKDRFDQTPLCMALSNDAPLELIQFLIERGSIVNCHSVDGLTPLHRAAELSTDIVKLLLDCGANPDAVSRAGRTPLHHAAKGKPQTVDILLALGNDINKCDNMKNTPLHLASNGGSQEVVKLLLKRGAKLELKNSSGRTALHLAIEGSYPSTHVQTLLQHGANVNSKDARKNTPLHLTAVQRDFDTTCALLKHGADPNVLGDWGALPLHAAIKPGGAKVVGVLIENGADVNAFDGMRNTPLTLSVTRYAADCVKVLLEHGAKTNVADGRGNIPLHYAVSRQSQETIRLLLKYNSDVNFPDNNGRTAFDIANEIASNTDDVINLLKQKNFE